MKELLVPLAFVAAWLLLQLVILPRMGVSTGLAAKCDPPAEGSRTTPTDAERP